MIRSAHRTRGRGSVGPAFAAASPAIVAAADLARRLSRTLAGDPDRFDSFRDAAVRRFDTLHWPTAPIRIGLDLPWAFADAVLNAPGCTRARFVPIDPTADDRAILDRQGLDAILRQTDAGPTRIVTPETVGRDAAWFDWARPTPLSYASVFPARIDPQLVTFSGLTRLQPSDARTVRLLLEAAALLARTPARLGLTDRLRGRQPIDFRLDRWHGTTIAAHVESLHDAMRELGKIVCDSSGDSPSPALAAAARAVSAWYVTADWLACEQIRRRVIEAAVRLLPDEPEPALRAVAIEFADLDDDAAMRSVVRAERVMRQHAHLAVADTGAFLQSEIDCGVAGPLTVGRVAAGICMLCALTEPDRLQFLSQDLAEDLRFAPWLIGCDADARVLIEVVRTIERAHGQRPALTLDTAA
ncbi:MAG: hypothetical protein IH985_08290 [Planctomycetes bacterium]|nr:hypothetical protein [Planctomycetota bacterium]